MPVVKTATLIGRALDYAVATAERLPIFFDGINHWVDIGKTSEVLGVNSSAGRPCGYAPSGFHKDGGPIIDRERIHICPITYNDQPMTQAWIDGRSDWEQRAIGATSLIAAMRCFVSAKLGDEVTVPACILNTLKETDDTAADALEAIATEHEGIRAQRDGLLTVLRKTIPALIRLGDFVGNHDAGGPSGQGPIDRCALVLEVRKAVAVA